MDKLSRPEQIHNFREPEEQVARWLAILSECNFRLSIIQVRSTKKADALSRSPCKQCGNTPEQAVATNVSATQSSLHDTSVIQRGDLCTGGQPSLECLQELISRILKLYSVQHTNIC